MTTEEKLLLALSFLTLVCGVVISYFLGQNEIPRAGALIVSLGVFFGANDISKYYSKAEREMRIKMIFDKINQRELANGQPDASHIFKATENSIENAYLNAFEEIDTSISRILKVEGFVIGAGTLLWGFGDLLYNSS